MTIDIPQPRHSQSAELLPPAYDAGLMEPQPTFKNSLSEVGLRDFYDPTSRRADQPIDEFLQQVAETRATLIAPALGRLSGYEVILAEATHCLLDNADGVGLPEVSENRQRQIVLSTVAGALVIARSVGEVADELTDQHSVMTKQLEAYGAHVSPLPNQLILSAKVLAAVAHAGIIRRSKREYFTHPEGVASEIRRAFEKLGYTTDDPDYTISQVDAYLHDAPEDNIDAFGNYVGADVPITPLVVKHLLQINDFQDARNHAKTLYYMMRVKDVDGNRLPYAQYVSKLLAQPEPISRIGIITKTADIVNNLNIDPDYYDDDPRKLRKILAKKTDYEAALLYNMNAAYDHSSWLGRLTETIAGITTDEVLAENLRNHTFRVSEVAARARQRVASNMALLQSAS